MKNVVIIFLLIVLILGIFTIAFSSPSREVLLNNPRKIVTVEKHQTLWEIASSINDGTYNTHVLISVIKKINNLMSAQIQPGQVLEVPVLKNDYK